MAKHSGFLLAPETVCVDGTLVPPWEDGLVAERVFLFNEFSTAKLIVTTEANRVGSLTVDRASANVVKGRSAHARVPLHPLKEMELVLCEIWKYSAKR